MSALPSLTAGAVAGAMAATAELLGPELRGGGGLAGSVRLRAHAVEAVLLVRPEVGAVSALALAGLPGPQGALCAATEMSGDGWEPRLVSAMARLLRLLDARPLGRATDHRTGPVDLTRVLTGDPDPDRAAQIRRPASPAFGSPPHG